MEAPKIPGIELGTELGRGAYSVVYKARQGAEACAVKVPQTRARWTREIYREAVALARVKHPGLPEVLEVGEVDGLPYLVMELVEGKTLADSLAAKRLDSGEVVEIAEQLASVLAAVHTIGLVHRDVKPRNIILDEAGALKLVDFGFTTPMERTGAGDTAGTALYAAPEQLVPPGRVDARSDLYCVGRVLLECLVGPSFAVFRTNAETIAEVVDQEAPLGLIQVIGHLLEVDPADRYPDAHALAKDLARVRRNQPILGPTGYAHERGALPTIARVRERRELVDAIRESRDAGRLVVVRGPRGSGKTRLIHAVEREVRAFTPTIVVTALAEDAPLVALRGILEAAWVTTSTQERALTTAELVELCGNLAPIAALISPRLGRELDLPDDAHLPDATDVLAEGAAEILLRIARKVGRLAIIIDDAQWMDLASASALIRVAHRVVEAPIVLLLGSRSELPRLVLERFLAVRATEAPTTELDLAKLDEDGVGRLVASHLGTRSVDPLVVARIAALADGTPLGVLEVLGAFLDVGALRPHARSWLFDAARLESVSLPTGTLALLGRRLNEIPSATRRILEAAAICGTAWNEARVAAVVGVPITTVEYASVLAHRRGLIEATDGDGYRFVHDSLREELVGELPEAERARLHQRVGEVISDQPAPTFEDLIAAARHLSVGVEGKDPARIVRVASAAALAAHERFDDEVALELCKQAAAAFKLLDVKPTPELDLVAAEASLRLGAVHESIDAFERALSRATTRLERARILGRISWAHETNADQDLAWETLGRAFEAVGEHMPVESALSAASTTAQLARVQIARFRSQKAAAASRSPALVELLCQLHYQNARLAFEYRKFARVVQSGLIAHSLSAQAQSAAMKARTDALHATTMAALGRGSALAQAEDALRLAKSSGDATAAAFCTQMLGMAASLRGNLDQGCENFQELVSTYGPWSELSEFCLHVMSIELMLSVQGKPREGWLWLEKAVARLRRSPAAPRSMLITIHRARAALAALDRDPPPESWLSKQFERIPILEAGRGYHRMMSWAPRLAYYVETDNLGPEFEALTKGFEAENFNARTADMSLAEYYMVLSHARLRQCFRTTGAQRALHIEQVGKVATLLRTAGGRISTLVPHAMVAEAYLAWFQDDAKKAQKLLIEAEAHAVREGLPWVLSNVAHARARFLAAEGKKAQARDQARIAETVALEHGAVSRARLIREEFQLVAAVHVLPVAGRASSRSSSSRTTRQLAALLHVAKGTRRDLKAHEHAALILDELLRSMDAERGSIWFQPEVPAAGTAVTRTRRSDASSSIAPDSPLGALLRSVHRRGASWPLADESEPPTAAANGFDSTRIHVVPLHLYEQPVGALAMERGIKDQPFTNEDRQLLELLAHQVPITLEIARLLTEREQLHVSLQQAQKMEAIGQLAGGIAHDFNNMLAAMKVALSAAQERAGDDREMNDELEIIAQATTRASQLTAQLLSFARHKPLPTSVQDINQLVVKLEPMLRRVATDGIEVSMRLSPAVDAVDMDPGSFDQVLMNLLINARDAMPKGGKFSVATRNVTLEENAAVRAHVSPGRYVEVEVSDTGEGMPPEIVARIFEPFFTTKPAGRGTGLGLATVYGFAKNCGGGIEVQSEVGKGTKFLLYLKRAERQRPARSSLPKSASSSGQAPTSPDTILVIDDDDLVRRSIAKILERHGYRVISANGSSEAMDVARTQGKRIGLVILDVLLPGVTGPELGRRLVDLDVAAKLLFVSGFSAESAPIEDANISAEMLLQKPFSQSALLERVKQLMPASTSN